MDIQLEVRAKSEYLDELEKKLERLQKFNKESDQKRTNTRLAKTNQFSKNKT